MFLLLNGSVIKGAGGGGEGLVIKKTKTFFLFCCHLRNIVLTYGHFTLKFVGRYLYWFVTIFLKNRAI